MNSRRAHKVPIAMERSWCRRRWSRWRRKSTCVVNEPQIHKARMNSSTAVNQARPIVLPKPICVDVADVRADESARRINRRLTQSSVFLRLTPCGLGNLRPGAWEEWRRCSGCTRALVSCTLSLPQVWTDWCVPPHCESRWDPGRRLQDTQHIARLGRVGQEKAVGVVTGLCCCRARSRCRITASRRGCG